MYFSLLLLFLHVLFIVFVFVFIVEMSTAIITGIPTLSTSSRAYRAIVEALAMKEGDYICDLGCGRANVLSYVVRHTKGVSGYGCEINFPVFLYARLKTFGLPVRISYTSFLSKETQRELQRATHVYCYLFPEVMGSVYPILTKNCKQGTKVVVCDFPFKHITPKKEIILSETKTVTKKIFIYEL